MNSKRPDFSALNVLTGAQITQWIEEDPTDPESISPEFNELLIEYVYCNRFITCPLKDRTPEQKAQSRELNAYCDDMRKEIIRLSAGKTIRVVLDLDAHYCCYLVVNFKEDPDGDERFSKWEIESELARKLIPQKVVGYE